MACERSYGAIQHHGGPKFTEMRPGIRASCRARLQKRKAGGRARLETDDDARRHFAKILESCGFFRYCLHLRENTSCFDAAVLSFVQKPYGAAVQISEISVVSLHIPHATIGYRIASRKRVS